MRIKERYEKALTWFEINMPIAESELNFVNEYQLLVAVMLSAQCTDKRVNMITRKLFSVYKTPSDYAGLSIEELEKYISSCNFYHNKAKNIISMSRVLLDEYGGEVPSSHGDLVKLPTERSSLYCIAAFH